MSQTQHNAHVAVAIPMMGYVLAWVFPIYVNFFNKETMDLHRDTDLNVNQPTEKELELERGTSIADKPVFSTVEHSEEVVA